MATLWRIYYAGDWGENIGAVRVSRADCRLLQPLLSLTGRDLFVLVQQRTARANELYLLSGTIALHGVLLGDRERLVLYALARQERGAVDAMVAVSVASVKIYLLARLLGLTRVLLLITVELAVCCLRAVLL